MSYDMEVRREALRMEYQQIMVRSNFIGIILIFCFFCIKTKEERIIFMRIQYQNPRDYVDLLLCSELTFGMYQDKRRKNNFYANTLLLDQKVFKKSRLTLSLRELPTTKIHFGFGNHKFYFLFHYRIQTASSLDSCRFIKIEF